MTSIKTLVCASARNLAFVVFALSATATPLAITASPALAHDYKIGAIHIGHPWARATPPRASVAGAFMVIENNGSEADRLVGGKTDAAAKVQIHSMTMEGDVMKMRQLEDGLEIPAGGAVKLAPGGYHLMLINPVAPLKEGTRIPLTLTFEKAGDVSVDLAVDGMGATGPGGGKSAHDGMAMDGAPSSGGEHAGHDAAGAK